MLAVGKGSISRKITLENTNEAVTFSKSLDSDNDEASKSLPYIKGNGPKPDVFVSNPDKRRAIIPYQICSPWKQKNMADCFLRK